MSSSTINWHRIYAITALNSAILICWMAYHFFQPKLLTQFGLEDAAKSLLTAQTFILILIPPISGYLADHFAKQLGNNYLLLTVGVSFTALIFFASAYVFLDMAPDSLKAMIPFFMVLWLIGMNIFYAPATGFILNSVKTEELPIAIAFVTVSLNLLFAVMGYLLGFLEIAGSSITFIIGGLLLIGSAYYYYKVAHKTEMISAPTETFKTNLLLTLWVGLLAGILNHWGLAYFSTAINPLFSGFDISTIVYIIAAILAFPLCYQLMKHPMINSFYIAWGAAMLAIMLAYFYPNMITAFISITVLSVSVSAVAVISFPYALSKVRFEHKNLAAGIFLGAFSLGMTLSTYFSF